VKKDENSCVKCGIKSKRAGATARWEVGGGCEYGGFEIAAGRET